MRNLRVDGRLLLGVALALPMLMGFYLPPLPTWLNQCLSLFLWGGAAWGLSACAWTVHGGQQRWADTAVALAALAGMVLLNGFGFGVSLAQPLIGCFALASAALLVQLGMRQAQQGAFERLVPAIAWGLLVLALLTAVACIMQVFLPQYCGNLILPGSRYAGRAVGTIGQPNLSGTAMAWGLIACAMLLRRRQLTLGLAWACVPLLVFAIVLTASRMAWVWIGLMLAWSWLDGSQDRRTRQLFTAALPLALLSWWIANLLVTAQGSDLALTQRTSDWASSSSRSQLWRQSLDLMLAHPWVGVGWADFSFAWTLTPFEGRGPRFHAHAHSLPLHLAVELGLPAALLFCALLVRGGLAAWRGVAQAAPAARSEGRLLLLMLAMLGLHSLLEYPLWYFFFLFPAAFLLGLCEGLAAPAEAANSGDRRPWPWLALGAALILGGLFSAYDYLKIARLYLPTLSGAAPDFTGRLAEARASVFNTSIAFRATATELTPGAAAVQAAEIAAHGQLDVRVLIAWANALAAVGDVDRARYLAQRVGEFSTPEVEAYQSACQSRPAPYQCQPPMRQYSLAELRR